MTIAMKRFLTIIILLSVLLHAGGAILPGTIPFRYRHFNNFDGRTASIHVRSVIQSSSGMVWMGTTGGLYSFDGYDIRRYENHEYPTGIVHCLTIYRGKIYLGCEKGLFVFDISSNKPELVEKLNNVNALLRHKDLLWLGTSKGLFTYSHGDNTCRSIEEVNRKVESPIMSLCVIDKSLYVGTLNDLGSYNMIEGSYKQINGEMPMVSSMLQHSDGKRLWVGTGNALYVYNPEKEALSTVCSVSVVKSIVYDNHGNLLLGSDNGLYVRSTNGGTAVVTHDARDRNSLPSDVVWDISSDDEGNLWFATDNGISLSQNDDCMRVFPLPALTLSGQGNQIYAINMSKDSMLWAGGSNGVIRLSGSYGGNPESRWYQMNDNKSFLPHNRIRRIFIDGEKRVWIASDRGLLLYDNESESFRHFTVRDNSYWIYDIDEDPEGNIWIASFSGVHCLGKDLGNWADPLTPISSFTSDNGLNSDRVIALGFDKNDYLWVLSDRLLSRIEFHSKKTERIKLENNGHPVYPLVLVVDYDGTAWATDGAVLFRLSSGADSIITDRIPLSSSPSVEALTAADTGKEIWVSTSDGIYTVDKKSLSVIHHATNRRFTSIFKNSDGKIWLGADDRLVEIHSNEDISSGNGNISVTGVRVNGAFSLNDSIVGEGRIVLPHDENTLEISFSDFSFDEIRFSTLLFKIDNAMPGWIKINADQNRIFLPNLSPGEYRLYIARAGKTADVSPILSIVIKEPWYLTTIARCLYAVAAILVACWIIYFIILRQRLTLERKERERLVEQGKSKVNFLSNISHEFKTPLNIIITSLSKLLKNHSDGSEKEMLGQAKINADKINSLLRMMSEAYQENDHFSPLALPSKIDVIELSTSIFDVCRDQYKGKGLEMNLSVGVSPLYVYADPFKMESIISNLLSNACKYTLSGGKVELHISTEASMLRIDVSDSGIGISDKDIPHIFRRYFRSREAISMGVEGSGIGLSAVKEYVEMHHGSIRVKSDSTGTEFTVLMPVLYESDATAINHDSETKEIARHDDSLCENTRQPLIAVIDDSNSTVNFISGLLKDRYRCVTASDGKSGLKLCLDLHPDLIITDLAMPVMDGLQMCSKLRSHTSMSTVPIIMLTGKNNPDSELKSLRINIDAFFEKPFDHTLFLAKIGQLLANRDKMKEQARIQSITAAHAEPVISADERLLRNVTRLIEDDISNPDFSVSMLSEKSGIGEKQLYRKIKMLTDLSTSEYIRSIRLRKAGVLLAGGGFTVSEVMYMVGFSNASYFTRCFKKEFGCTPVEYMANHRK